MRLCCRSILLVTAADPYYKKESFRLNSDDTCTATADRFVEYFKSRIEGEQPASTALLATNQRRRARDILAIIKHTTSMYFLLFPSTALFNSVSYARTCSDGSNNLSCIRSLEAQSYAVVCHRGRVIIRKSFTTNPAPR